MDEGQFYDESDQKNGKYFKSLMAKWKKSGGGFKWGAGGMGLRGAVDEKEIGICFLTPTYAGKKTASKCRSRHSPIKSAHRRAIN